MLQPCPLSLQQRIRSSSVLCILIYTCVNNLLSSQDFLLNTIFHSIPWPTMSTTMLAKVNSKCLGLCSSSPFTTDWINSPWEEVQAQKGRGGARPQGTPTLESIWEGEYSKGERKEWRRTHIRKMWCQGSCYGHLLFLLPRILSPFLVVTGPQICFRRTTLSSLKYSSPQPFWHQGLVSWKTIFPQTREWGVGVGRNGFIVCHQMQFNCHLSLTDRVLIRVCKQLIYYGPCAVEPLC